MVNVGLIIVLTSPNARSVAQILIEQSSHLNDKQSVISSEIARLSVTLINLSIILINFKDYFNKLNFNLFNFF